MPFRSNYLIIFFALITLHACYNTSNNANVMCKTYNNNVNCSKEGLNLGMSFPPIQNSYQRDLTQTYLKDLAIKKIRFEVHWDLREPIKNNFNWTPLDERLLWTQNEGLEVLLTIGAKAPDWACTLIKNNQSCIYKSSNDLKNFIDTLLIRYSNQIARIQYANEWQNDFGFIGSKENFVTYNNILFSSVGINSPTTKVVLGGFSIGAIRTLTSCAGKISSYYQDDGYYDSKRIKEICTSLTMQEIKNKIDHILLNANYDLVDLHFYDDVENWQTYFNHLATLVTKPIIVSEFGGPHLLFELYNEDYQASRLAEYIETLKKIGVSGAYFFKLVATSSAHPPHAESGLLKNGTLGKKISYYIFKGYSNP